MASNQCAAPAGLRAAKGRACLSEDGDRLPVAVTCCLFDVMGPGGGWSLVRGERGRGALMRA